MIGIGLRYYARLSEALFEDLAEATRSPTLKVGMCPLRLSGLSYGTDRGPNREWNRILIHFSPEGLSPELLFFFTQCDKEVTEWADRARRIL